MSEQTYYQAPSGSILSSWEEDVPISEDSKYRDFAVASPELAKQLVDCPKNKRRGPRGGVVEPFPLKLYDMLEGVMEEGKEDIVSWQVHGRCFMVHKPQQFVDIIMPRYFRQSKMTSFQRQLNLYGFQRLTTGRDRGGYFHELFLRGRPDLCRVMTRTRVRGNGSTQDDFEPEFYSMPYCGETRTAETERNDITCPALIPSIPNPTPLDQMTNKNAISSSTAQTVAACLTILTNETPEMLGSNYYSQELLQEPALIRDDRFLSESPGPLQAPPSFKYSIPDYLAQPEELAFPCSDIFKDLYFDHMSPQELDQVETNLLHMI